jgi:hypothetical protein
MDRTSMPRGLYGFCTKNEAKSLRNPFIETTLRVKPNAVKTLQKTNLAKSKRQKKIAKKSGLRFF